MFCYLKNKPLLMGERLLPARASQFLEAAKGSAGSLPWRCEVINPESASHVQVPREAVFLYFSLASPGASDETTTIAQSPLK